MFIRLVLMDIGVVPSSGLVQRVLLGSFSCSYTGACVHAFLRVLPPSLGFSLWKGFKLGIQFSLDMQLGGPWDSSPWSASHVMLWKSLLTLSASLLPDLELGNHPEKEHLQTPASGLLCLHYSSSCLANSSLWCELSDAPRKMIFVFCVTCMFVLIGKIGRKLPSLPWSSTSNFSLYQPFSFSFSFTSQRRKCPLFSKASPYLCDFSPYLSRMVKHLHSLPSY